jgi:hypothetical protein
MTTVKTGNNGYNDGHWAYAKAGCDFYEENLKYGENKSTLRCKMYINIWSDYYTQPGRTLTSVTLSLNGTAVKTWSINKKISVPSGYNGDEDEYWYYLDDDYTQEFTHETDGTKTVTVSISLQASGGSPNPVTGSGSVTLTRLKYTISYAAGTAPSGAGTATGALTAGYKTHDTAFTLPNASTTAAAFSATGAHPVSWRQGSASGTVYALGGSYTGNANTTFYVGWALDTYTITYDKNGGNNS